MFRNWLSSAWGDLRRSPVQSFIAIGGLAIGLAAAILAGIVTLNQYSYDHLVPAYQRLYYSSVGNFPASGPGKRPSPGLAISARGEWQQSTPSDLAATLRNFTAVAGVARLGGGQGVFGRVGTEAREDFYYADPNFFHLMPLPLLYGDLNQALAGPDRMVVSLSTARKYFGRDNPIGQTLTLDHRYPLTVTAVIADLPPNATNIDSGIFVSGLAPSSPMSQDIGKPGLTHTGAMHTDVRTIVLLNPGASVESLDRQLTAWVESFSPPSFPIRRAMRLVPADRWHVDATLNKNVRTRLDVFGAVALLTLLLACVNFINLSTARAVRRGLEVGIRKSAGAGRWVLMLQFLGESILQVLLALAIAMLLVEWLLPPVNAFLESGAVFDYWREPQLLAALLGGAVLVGAMAGFYPALVLSSFRPVTALKGLLRGSGGLVRQALAMLQFAALVVLLIGAGLVFQQNRFATRGALRANIDQMLVVRMPACNPAFEDQVRALAGVKGAVCSGMSWLPNFVSLPPARSGRDGVIPLSMKTANSGLFELYGLKPLAGRFFDPRHGDRLPPDPPLTLRANYVINLEAVRRLGFVTPAQAIGKPVTILTMSQAFGLPSNGKPPPALSGVVVGVVDDFGFQSPEQPDEAAAYSDGPAATGPGNGERALLNIKLKGADIPETLDAIDAAWKNSGSPDPIDRTFMDAYVQENNIAVLRQAQAFGVFAGVAALLACLGLFGVSLSTTARRIKEIGVRKAMGARNRQIVTLLLWQFAQPVLWANVIAWPIAWWAMNRWLSGFAYHVPLHWWLFPAAGAATLLIALITVASQAVLVARQKPVLALRYE